MVTVILATVHHTRHPDPVNHTFSHYTQNKNYVERIIVAPQLLPSSSIHSLSLPFFSLHLCPAGPFCASLSSAP